MSIEHELTCSVLDGGCAFCGVTVQEYAVNGVTYSWRKGSHLRVALDFDDLGALQASQVKDAVVAALKEISDCCDITHELIASSLNANLKVILARLDGRMGVLADCQLPQPGSTPDSTQLLMRIDTSERWGLSVNPTGDMIDFYRVFLHEALHGHGLGHKPNSVRDPALIAPMYSPLIRNLQQADKSELVRRYSAPQPKQPPSQPPATGAPAEIPVVVTATTPWGQYSAKGPLKPVKQGIYIAPYPAGEFPRPVEQLEAWHDQTDGGLS